VVGVVVWMPRWVFQRQMQELQTQPHSGQRGGGGGVSGMGVMVAAGQPRAGMAAMRGRLKVAVPEPTRYMGRAL
jgi:hypothetical protein